MKKITLLASALVVGAVFATGVAVGKDTAAAKFMTKDEVKLEELMPGGPKLGAITGDPKKGPYMALMQISGGSISPMHSHTGDYEGVQISGTSRHWVKGEDGAKAKKMTPGSYWSMPGGMEHVSACDKGADCVLLLIQKSKFDFVPGKDAAKPVPPAKK